MKRYIIPIAILAAISVSLSAYTVRAQEARQLAGSPGQTDKLCWAVSDGKEQCVPLSIVKATFDGYVDGDAPPVNQLRQALINAQLQFANQLKLYRECVGQLGPLQAGEHQRQLQRDQDQLNDDNRKAAPVGTEWDPATGKYGPPKLPVPTPTPSGRGRGGR